MRVAGIPLGVGQNTLSATTVLSCSFAADFTDATGRHTLSTIAGTPTFADSALFLNTGDLVRVGASNGDVSADFNFNSAVNVEISCELKMMTIQNNGRIWSFGTSDSSFFPCLRIQDTGKFQICNNASTVILEYTNPTSIIGVWKKVTLTRNATGLHRLFIDDVERASYEGTTGNLTTANNQIVLARDGFWQDFYIKNLVVKIGVGQQNTFDPSLTLALLHFDGANNSTVFTDNSPFNQTVAVVTGTPKISTAMSRFGGSSLYLDGSSSIKIPNNANLNLGTGAFTIEFWFYLLSLPSSDAWFLHKSGSPQQAISISHSTRQLFSGFLSASLVSAATITAGAWHHVAVVRESANGQIKQYFNGLNEGTMNNSGSVDNAGDLTIGSWFSGSDAITGYIDEFRIRKEAMYLANFTPPTQPFTY